MVLERIKRSDVMREIARRSMNWTPMSVEIFEIVANAINGAECYSIITGDIHATVNAISALLDS